VRRHLKKINLRIQFLLLLLGLLLILFTAVIFVAAHEDSKNLKNNLVTNSKSFAALATQPIGSVFETFQNSGTLKIQEEINNVTSLQPDISQIEIIDTSNNRQFIKNPAQPISIDPSLASKIDPTYIYDKKNNLTAVVQPYIESYGIHKYNVIYGISYTRINQDIRDIIIYISLLTITIMVAIFVLGYILIERIFLNPVIQVSHRALKISEGEFNQPVSSSRDDEIGVLAESVETMAGALKSDIDKLKQLEKMKNEFLMIISHNLRTPLAVIENYLELINKSADQQFKKLLEPIRASVIRLHGFAEDIITVSEMEASYNPLKLTLQPIKGLLDSVSKEFSDQARQKNISFEAKIETNCNVLLNQPGLRNALWNLLDNAYKFTLQGGKIVLNATDDGRNVHISVSDNGPGIKTEEINKLFTKFHRGSSTLRYDYEGSGIGLYLSRIIINQHQGDISVNSTEGKGAVFTITLPVAV
jgi:signal transduction histidine kinase